MTATDLTKTSSDTNSELATFEELKPFIARCLTLNHDINNPLAGIVGYCEFLIEEQDNMTPEQRDYVVQILKCTERIQAIVERLGNEKIALGKKIDIPKLIKEYGPSEVQS
jgi:nitrogen-specific signal transduction histidine kinase